MNKYEKFIKYTLPQLVALFLVGMCLSDGAVYKVIGGISVIFIAVSNYEQGLNNV